MKKMKYHPSSEIIGTHSLVLKGITIVVGVTSSAAIYRSVDVVRELMRKGAEVYVVMSRDATKLISPTLFEWATGNEVLVEFGGETGHIALSRICSSMVIAPATLNTIAKIAYGITDTSVTLTAVTVAGMGKPLIIVPAMHKYLWDSPQAKEALSKVKEWNCAIVPPIIEENKAKFPLIEDIVSAAEALTLRGRDLTGFKILITAGPTREFLDPVRFLTNASSGRMGIAIAREAYFRGAEVTLIHGPVPISVPHYVRRVKVTTTSEMLSAVMNEVESRNYDAVILAGAPADYSFSVSSKEKIKSVGKELELILKPTPKISSELRKVFNGLIIGFAAETVFGDINKLIKLAQEKLKKRGFNIIVANDISRHDIGFASEFNEVYVVDDKGVKTFIPKSPKSVVARRILDIIRDRVTSK
ncbi:MAG: bifunctional phosphopantothenoylcysteine decarboxylase/phosphopantothenate--cysteine ligase CoaBC [Desulfurococcales archaeon]|nr:bifunctional phosphopantothenoylcysteine decarboxylase/phosphopantothenate--cysteine ligase CoaBC [Desulfurococcales archaeon]